MSDWLFAIKRCITRFNIGNIARMLLTHEPICSIHNNSKVEQTTEYMYWRALSVNKLLSTRFHTSNPSSKVPDVMCAAVLATFLNMRGNRSRESDCLVLPKKYMFHEKTSENHCKFGSGLDLQDYL